jgi:hypothetical protein
MTNITKPETLHLSIDLETLSTHTADCPILEIGVTVFTKIGIITSARFSPKIVEGVISEDTFEWWHKDERVLTYVDILSSSTHPTLRVTLEAMLTWIKESAGLTDLSKTTVWANSPSFDLAILQWWCSELAIEWPFTYNKERDIRTMRKFMKAGVGAWETLPFPADLKPHRAEDDSKYQALEVIAWHGGYEIL